MGAKAEAPTMEARIAMKRNLQQIQRFCNNIRQDKQPHGEINHDRYSRHRTHMVAAEMYGSLHNNESSSGIIIMRNQASCVHN